MSSKDLHSNMTVASAFDSQTIATDTTTTGNIIDTDGYYGLEFVLQAATLTAGTFAPLLEHDTDAGFGTATLVAADDIINDLADATFADTDDNAVKRIGYAGKKRYVRLSVVSTGTANGVLAGVAVLGAPCHAPTAD